MGVYDFFLRKRGGMSEDKRNEDQNPQRSKKLLERFLSSSDFQQPLATSPWDQNPLLQELARSVKTQADFEYIEGLLRDNDRHNALISTLHSMTSTGTISSSSGSEITLSTITSSTNRRLLSSSTIPAEPPHSRQSHDGGERHLDEGSDNQSLNQALDNALRLRCTDTAKLKASLEVSEMEPVDGQGPLHQNIGVPLTSSDALGKFHGVWHFKKHPKSDITHLHRLIDLDKSQIKRNLDQNFSLEIKVNKEMLSMRTEIIGLCNVDLPLAGSPITTARFDRYEGSMEIHAEAKRFGLRTIYTWGHPLAGTRRDTLEVSSCGKELTIMGYITRRDGTNCKTKWSFVKGDA